MSGDQADNANSNQEDQKPFDGGSAPFDDQQQQRRFQNQNNFRGRGRGFGGGPPRGYRGRGRGFGGRGGGGQRHGDDRGPQDNDMNDRMGGHQGGGFRFEDKLMEKLAQIGGPAVDLPPIELSDRKYSGKFRLYIGNLPDVTEEELKELLGKHGDCGELFLNKEKSFAFAKFDFLATSEKVKRELDGFLLKGKNLKIRTAPIVAAIKVKNLTNFVSNELLYHAFQVFGEVEKAVVLVDEKGRSTGEGIVEFARKGHAQNAIRICNERCFFITESLRPVIVEHFELINDTDGCPEKYLPKRHHDYMKARSKGPRLADTNSFEHDYGTRWKQLLELYSQKEDALKKELQLEKDKLEAQMEYARYEHETEMLRQQLRAREQDRDRQKQEWETKERQADEFRRGGFGNQGGRRPDNDDLRRRQQENNLFMQAHQLDNLLEEQEQAFQKPPPPPEGEEGGSNDGVQQDGHGNGGPGGNGPQGMHGGGPQRGPGGRGGFGRDRWITDRRDDFQSKRRRF